MDLVSVIIPTYNRGEIITKSLNSVLAQTFQDFELIVIDDGSTDNTYDMIKDLDPRLKIIRQQNQGVGAARNTGIRASKGKYIAFLDSDDEWNPIYLEACISFLENHPDENVINTEFLWNLRKNYFEIEPIRDLRRVYIPLAKRVGSTLLNLPPGETDHYLRIYKEKIPVGKWAESFLKKIDRPFKYYYRGYIFEHWRWGYIMTLWSTVITRESINHIGGFNTKHIRAGDYDFLSRLCKNYRINFLPFPGAIKNEYFGSGEKFKEEHLASGKNQVLFAITYVERFEDAFLKERPNDEELLKIKAQNLTYISEVALSNENQEVASHYARAALEIDPNIFRAKLILFLLKLLPNTKLPKIIYCILVRFKKLIKSITYL